MAVPLEKVKYANIDLDPREKNYKQAIFLII